MWYRSNLWIINQINHTNKMKFFSKVLIMASFVMALAGCQEDPKELTPEIKMGQTTVSLGSNGDAVSVAYIVENAVEGEKIAVENMLVLVDDLNLPFGSIRMRKQGSNGGHNGLGHIQQVLGTQNYARLRFGIGNDFNKGAQCHFVLGQWSDEEQKLLPDRLKLVSEIIPSFCLQGMDRTMNQYNGK
jgi:hypothetical protein